jgi:hypothetical protein
MDKEGAHPGAPLRRTEHKPRNHRQSTHGRTATIDGHGPTGTKHTHGIAEHKSKNPDNIPMAQPWAHERCPIKRGKYDYS